MPTIKDDIVALLFGKEVKYLGVTLDQKLT